MATRQASKKRASGRKPPVVTASPTAKPGKPAGARAAGSSARASTRTGSSANGSPEPRNAAAKAAASSAVAELRLARVGGALRAFAGWAGGVIPLATLIVSIVGLADASYLTYQHFSQSTSFAGCSETGAINCVAVTTSSQSMVFGVLPVAVLGLAFFIFMVAINSPWAWRAPWRVVPLARLGSVIVGMGMVLYLLYAELFQINAICLYCTGVHILTFILFALVVTKASLSGLKPADSTR